MKCINCGGEINGGTPFCPLCGAVQNAVGDSSENVNNRQQTYVQQQPLYVQPQPPYGQQFNQWYAQNNIQNPIKKKSKAPLIIGIVAAILIIAGLTVGIVLIISKNSNTSTGDVSNINTGDVSNTNTGDISKVLTAEDTIEAFLDALLEGDYSEAMDYIHPEVLKAARSEVKEKMKRYFDEMTSYDVRMVRLNSDELAECNEEVAEEFGVDVKATVGIFVKIESDIYTGFAFTVMKTNGKWYIVYFSS